tara:strand:- start:831 stop:2426 length:1596 start_codon:yes stop_codon:yes gene_type:complete
MTVDSLGIVATYLSKNDEQMGLINWLYGYDFFISYHWDSGGAYAVNLAQQLRDDLKVEVFLDRSHYAAGENLKTRGEIALQNSKRLILLATDEAIHNSEWVEKEVKYFNRKERVIPIFFGKPSQRQLATTPLLQQYSSSVLHIVELDMEELAKNHKFQASPEVLNDLKKSKSIWKVRTRRILFFSTIWLIVLATSITAALMRQNAYHNQQYAAFKESQGLVENDELFISHASDSLDLAIQHINRTEGDNVRKCSLNMPGMSITGKTIQRLLSLNFLEELTFQNEQQIASGAFMPLGQSAKLRRLNIANIHDSSREFNLDHLSEIASIPQLTYLRYHDSGLTPSNIEVLKKSNIEVLDLSGNDLLDGTAFATLLQMPKLHSLCLDENHVAFDKQKSEFIAGRLAKSKLELLSLRLCKPSEELQAVLAHSQIKAYFLSSHMSPDLVYEIIENPMARYINININNEMKLDPERVKTLISTRQNPLVLDLSYEPNQQKLTLGNSASVRLVESKLGFQELPDGINTLNNFFPLIME